MWFARRRAGASTRRAAIDGVALRLRDDSAAAARCEICIASAYTVSSPTRKRDSKNAARPDGPRPAAGPGETRDIATRPVGPTRGRATRHACVSYIQFHVSGRKVGTRQSSPDQGHHSTVVCALRNTSLTRRSAVCKSAHQSNRDWIARPHGAPRLNSVKLAHWPLQMRHDPIDQCDRTPHTDTRDARTRHDTQSRTPPSARPARPARRQETRPRLAAAARLVRPTL